MLESHTLILLPLSNFALVLPKDFQEVTTNLHQHQDCLVQRVSEWVFKNMKNVVLKNEILKCIHENKRNMKLKIYIKARWEIQNFTMKVA